MERDYVNRLALVKGVPKVQTHGEEHPSVITVDWKEKTVSVPSPQPLPMP